FFTHHHFDHDVDYPCFLLCRWDQGAGKEVPLRVYGPPPTALLTERLLDPAVGAISHVWQARIRAREGSVVVTGDTAPCPPVIDVARGADVLLRMCWDDQAAMDANGESPGQCGTIGAARIAQEAKVRRLLLTHIGPRVTQREVLEQARRDVAAHFTGEVI